VRSATSAREAPSATSLARPLKTAGIESRRSCARSFRSCSNRRRGQTRTADLRGRSARGVSEISGEFNLGCIHPPTARSLGRARGKCIIGSKVGPAPMEREEHKIFYEHLKSAGLKRTTQ